MIFFSGSVSSRWAPLEDAAPLSPSRFSALDREDDDDEDDELDDELNGMVIDPVQPESTRPAANTTTARRVDASPAQREPCRSAGQPNRIRNSGLGRNQWLAIFIGLLWIPLVTMSQPALMLLFGVVDRAQA